MAVKSISIRQRRTGWGGRGVFASWRFAPFEALNQEMIKKGYLFCFYLFWDGSNLEFGK